MLKYIITLGLLIGIISAKCQSTVVKSFRWLDPSLNTQIPKSDKDLTGKKFAIIKIENNQSDLEFDFGSPKNILASAHKPGETWFWIPEGTQKVTISNKQTGVLCIYPFDKELEASEVYVMVLDAEKLTPSIEKSAETKWLNLNSSPFGADIIIDGYPAGQTPYYGSLSLGSHKLEMKMNGEKKEETLKVEKGVIPFINIAFEPDSTLKNDSTNNPQTVQNCEFKGGISQMHKFLRDHIIYPTLAQMNGIKGTVNVKFIVSETGKIRDIKILQGLGGGCNEAVVQTIMLMPNWSPMRIGGRAVPSSYSIPFKYNSLGTLNEKQIQALKNKSQSK